MKKMNYVLGVSAAMSLMCVNVAAQVSWSHYFPTSDHAGTTVIAAGDSVLLDVCDLQLQRLEIFGELLVSDSGFAGCDTASLQLETLLLSGKNARLAAGSEDQPLATPWTITLTGDVATMTMGTAAGSSMGEPRQIMVMGGAQLEMHGLSATKTAWSSLSATAHAGERFIQIDDATGWRAGDRLVIASSNIDPREAEVVLVAAADAVGQSLELVEPLRFDHFGSIQYFAGKAIDSRAEVGLLSHTIVIEGDADSATSGIGGNIMIMNDSMERPESSRQTLLRPDFEGRPSAARLRGIELRSMGQRGRGGRYPLHWHLVDNGSESSVSNSSVHHGFQRAVVMHGTDSVTVQSVVAYHIPNHMFVPSEEGDEAHNRFLDNLGILSLPVAAEDFAFPSSNNPRRSDQSEERNSVFWLRSSFNELRGNHAAGAWRGQGFFLDHGGMNNRSMKYAHRASGTPEICNFEDNLAHSIYVGLGSPDLYTPTVRGFGLFTTSHARRYARNPDRFTQCTLGGFRAYKTQNGGVWSENGTILEDLLVTDSHMGVVAGDVIRDAVVVGQTDNRLTSGALPGKSDSANPDRSRGGFVQSNNGGQRVDGRVFDGLTCINLPTCFFVQTKRTSEIGQLTNASITDVTLVSTPQGFSVGGDPVVFSDDSIRFGTFRDLDGALSGEPGYEGPMDSSMFFEARTPYINRWGWIWEDTPAKD